MVEEEKQYVGCRYPDPIYLDKVEVHEIALQGEVAGSLFWGMGLG